MNINELASKIYREEPINQPLRQYYLNYLSEVRKYGKYDFLIANFNSFTLSSNINLMLVLPELWNTFGIDNWIELIERNRERPKKLRFTEIDTGKFSDIVFISKYLELDGIDLAVNHSNLTEDDKKAILNYANIFYTSFAKDIFDIEAIDGTVAREIGYEPFGCDLSELHNIKINLLADKRTKGFPSTIEQVEIYIKEMYRL